MWRVTKAMCHMEKTENSSLPWDGTSAFRPPMSLVAEFKRENYYLQQRRTKFGTTL